MARHRKGLRRLVDPKRLSHGLFSALTRGRPDLARRLDFFSEYGRPAGARVLHDDLIVSPLASPRYAEQLAFTRQFSVETRLREIGTPDFPDLRRLVWEAPGLYVPGGRLAPADLETGRLASLTREGPSNWSTSRPRLSRRPPLVAPGRAALVSGMRHYGHLLTDYLAPLAFAARRGLLAGEAPATLLLSAEATPVARSFVEGLARMGLARALPIARDGGVICETYVQAEFLAESGEHRFAAPEITPFLREIFFAGGGAPPPPSRHEKVYLTRGGAKLRKVAGEAELIEGLRARGFHIFEARWDNHLEQIETFGAARVIAGVHGAGLANALFGRADALLIEIQAQNARKTTGLHWAASAGMDYRCLLGGPEGDRQSFAIDPAATLREIDGLLA